MDFTGTPPARRVRSHRPFGFAMTGLCKCIQTNCDSLRSHVIIDRDGSSHRKPRDLDSVEGEPTRVGDTLLTLGIFRSLKVSW